MFFNVDSSDVTFLSLCNKSITKYLWKYLKHCFLYLSIPLMSAYKTWSRFSIYHLSLIVWIQNMTHISHLSPIVWIQNMIHILSFVSHCLDTKHDPDFPI